MLTRSARRWARWLYWAAAIIIAFIAAGLQRLALIHGMPVEIATIGFIVGFPVSGLAIWFVIAARRAAIPDAESVRKSDLRPSVLYLRPFADDDAGERGQGSMAEVFGPVIPFERSIVNVLRSLGPVVAIERPGEYLPALGAARLRIPHENWQRVVKDELQKAKIVVVRCGVSRGVLEELEMIDQVVEPTRLYLYFPLQEKDRLRRWREMLPILERHLGHALPATWETAFLSFREDWTAERIQIPARDGGFWVGGASDSYDALLVVARADPTRASDVERRQAKTFRQQSPVPRYVGAALILLVCFPSLFALELPGPVFIFGALVLSVALRALLGATDGKSYR
jgi:hypothetical protein